MNKRKIRLIIVLMTFALTGIIALQAYWIQEAIKIKEQEFEQSVIQAMNNVVDKIETREAFHIIKDRFLGFDSMEFGSLLLNDTINDIPVHVNRSGFNDGTYSEGPPPVFEDLDNADINIEFRPPGSPRTIIRFQRRNSYVADSTQERFIRSSNMTKIFSDSTELTVRKNQEKVKSRLAKIQKVMQQVAVEYIGKENEAGQRIDAYQLDTLIRQELANQSIDLECSYGVMNGSTGKLLLSKSSLNPADLLNSKFKTLLFPKDIFLKPDYLILNFPSNTRYIFETVWIMLLGSSIFTLIIVISFAYTILVIFRQKKLSDIKTDFINNMTHEFKTPIATISLATDSIRDSRVSQNKEKLDYFLNIIGQENKRMNSQVENVLRMAQIEKGELQLNKEEVNIHSVIQHAVDYISLQIEAKNGHITTLLNAERYFVNGDPIHLSNVIFNLLDNANKYSPLSPKITIETLNHKNQLTIRVSDEGMGMTKDTQKRIFEKFYRVPTGNLHDIKGFGLGLSYVKAIVEQHHGTIAVSSEPNEGSTFEIALPLNETSKN